MVFVRNQVFSLLSAAALLGFAACNSVSDQLEYQAQVNGQAQADRQVQANNEDLAAKAKAMQDDLDTRQRFYQGVAGTYEGIVTYGSGAQAVQLHTRFTLVPSLPPYHSDRVRALEEIISDLNNLHLNAEVVQWDPATGATFGCIFGNIQPDLNDGEIHLIAPECANAFSLALTPSGPLAAGPNASISSETSASVARELLDAQESSVQAMRVEMDPTRTSDTYSFAVQRVRR